MFFDKKGPYARDWACSERFAVPIKWGQIEEQVISLKLRPTGGTEKSSALLLGLGLAAMVIPIVFGLIFVLAPVIAAGLVAWATHGSSEAKQSDLLGLARVLMVVSMVVSLVGIGHWWQTRSRWSVALVAGLLAVLGAAGTFFFGLSYEGDLPADGLEFLTLVAGVLGLLVVGTQAISRPTSPSVAPRSGRAKRRCDAARDEVVDVLIERKLVELTDDQRHRMRRMPVGTWHKFDSQGRV